VENAGALRPITCHLANYCINCIFCNKKY